MFVFIIAPVRRHLSASARPLPRPSGTDMISLYVTIAIIALLLTLSAFFSGSETALTAASRPLMHQLEQNGNPRAGVVNRLHAQTDRLIGTILLGNNLVNILASSLATSVLITVFGEAGIAYATHPDDPAGR